MQNQNEQLNIENIILEKKGANFFGIERIDLNGKKHYKLAVIRGNGNLKLTKSGVTFSRWLPKKEFFIPFEKIREVNVRRSHNLKSSIFLPVLKITYEEEEELKIFGVCLGRKKDTYIWKDKIEELMKIK
ncbi:MAG: hypothetical protein KAW88_00400 [Candidatus Cloacimonetes bacterium]|nr:hypothetical protein [Candidatus Cloacimonadota bacterium]